jgi:hypothetical protein
MFLLSPIRAKCPVHLILLDLIILIILGKRVEVIKLLNMQFSPCSRHFISLRSKYFLSILFSDILSLCSSLNVTDQVSHPYRTTDKIIVLYIPVCMFLDSRREDKRFRTEW